MNDARKDGKNLAKLRRLQRLRISQAEADYLAKRAEHDRVLRAMQERQARIDNLYAQRREVIEYAENQSANDMGRLAPFFKARQDFLAYELEREEYWLKDDAAEVAEAEKQMAAARQQWVVLCTRDQGLEKLAESAAQTLWRAALRGEEMAASDNGGRGRNPL